MQYKTKWPKIINAALWRPKSCETFYPLEKASWPYLWGWNRRCFWLILFLLPLLLSWHPLECLPPLANFWWTLEKGNIVKNKPTPRDISVAFRGGGWHSWGWGRAFLSSDFVSRRIPQLLQINHHYFNLHYILSHSDYFTAKNSLSLINSIFHVCMEQ